MKSLLFYIPAILLLTSRISVNAQEYNERVSPKQYTCLKTTTNMVIDGYLAASEWNSAVWTDNFVDIEGTLKPKPLHHTRVKMLWDETYLFIAAEMIEPHIWATYDQSDAIIFHENDFEVFIDPDGDTHNYYELEVNALGTIWDLMLIKPYRDGGPAIDEWDIRGLKKGITIDGSLNDGTDIDKKWVVELAIPLASLFENTQDMAGTISRINFSRVNWRTFYKNGSYHKQKDTLTNRDYPEYNWVWSPQGEINMHVPEKWGYLYFAEDTKNSNLLEHHINQTAFPKWILRQIYHAQKNYLSKHGHYADQIKKLSPSITNKNVTTYTTPSLFEVIYKTDRLTTWHIDQDGRTWNTVTELKK